VANPQKHAMRNVLYLLLNINVLSKAANGVTRSPYSAWHCI